MVALAVAAIGAWFVGAMLAGREPLLAYGLAFIVALLTYAANHGARPAVPDIRVSPVALGLLAVVALTLRLAAPDIAPAGVTEDEARIGIDCMNVLHGSTDVLAIGWVNHPNFPCLILSPLLRAFGPGSFALHVYPAVTGTLSIVAFFFLARMFLPAALALLSAALLVTSPNHLFYSRVLWGADILLPEIFFLAFVIDAARRLSLRSALFAGSALGILLYEYIPVRILPLIAVATFVLAQLHDRRRFWRRFVLLGTIAVIPVLILMPLLLRPDGWSFFFNPVHVRLLPFNAHMSFAEIRDQLVHSLRDSLLLFHEPGVAGAQAHTRTTILPLGLEVMLALGFGAALARLPRFPAPLAAVIFVVGLLPAVLSDHSNGHRVMMALPAVFLLIGGGFELLSSLLPAGRRSARLAVGSILVIVVATTSLYSTYSYFERLWIDANDLSQLGDYSSGVGMESKRLSALADTYVTSLPVELEFLNYDEISARRVHPLSFADLVPQNWERVARNFVFDVYRADLPWNLHDVFADHSSRFFVNAIGRTTGSSMQFPTTAIQRLHHVDGECGTLSFGRPQRVVAISAGDLQIGSIRSLGSRTAQPPWFAAGLLPACIRGDVQALLEGSDGKKQEVQLTASDLYGIEVAGWVRRISCIVNQDRVEYLSVEPFLYNLSTFPPVRTNCYPTQAREQFSALVTPHSEPLTLAITTTRPSDLRVALDGQPVALDWRSPDRGAFVIAPNSGRQRLQVGTAFLSDLTLYQQRGEFLELPRYRQFAPPPDELSIDAGDVRWGKLLNGAFPPGTLRR